jgi:hypothetical protein
MNSKFSSVFAVPPFQGGIYGFSGKGFSLERQAKFCRSIAVPPFRNGWNGWLFLPIQAVFHAGIELQPVGTVER